MPRTITTVLPKTANTIQYQAASNGNYLSKLWNTYCVCCASFTKRLCVFGVELMPESISVSNASSLPSLNGNNSTILSLLANTTQSSPSSSATNITLSNLLTSSAAVRSLNQANTVNVTGQRVVAKRVKMQNAARVISSTSPIATSLANATVIAATSSASNTVANVNAQPVIRLSLSSLTNQVSFHFTPNLIFPYDIQLSIGWRYVFSFIMLC